MMSAKFVHRLLCFRPLHEDFFPLDFKYFGTLWNTIQNTIQNRNMWHEARKHEKKIRGIMIDHRRRAEKRREFYASIRRDPASYLQIHGQQMRIHIDPAISQAAESSLVPWIGDGDQKNMIDRFDVRANLDCIPTSVDVSENLLSSDQECQLNYERFRGLIQNDFLDNSEEKVLQNIILKERWAPAQQQQQPQNIKSKIEMKKKLAEKKAAIGYNYDVDPDLKTNATANEKNSSSDSEESDEDEDEDMDTIVLVDQLDPDMCQRLNIVAKKYGVKSGSFAKFMQSDKLEADRIRLATEIEHEKSMFVGRKSRRARKNMVQQHLMILRSLNNNVDADKQVDHFGGENCGGDKSRKSKSQDDSDSSNSSSSSSSDDDNESKSEVDEGKIEFITSFGNDEADVDDPNSKKFQKKMRKLEKKRLKESKKKITAKHSDKFKQQQQQTSNETLMYGPSLPIGLIDAKKESDHDNVRFKHSSTNSSQIKTRHYRFNKDMSEEDRSPEHRRRIRRSPSVRRRNSSEDDEDDHDVKFPRSRQDRRSPIRRYHSPPSRYRSSNDRKTSHRSRSRSRSRDRTRTSYRSPEHRRATFRHSRSPIDRRRSKETKRSKDRRRSRSRSKSPVSSHNKKRGISSPDRVMEKVVDPPKQEDESNAKLYKLLEKIENNVKKAAASSSKSSEDDGNTKEVSQTKPTEQQVVEKDRRSPPIKRYYRHDLVDKSDLSGESDSDQLKLDTFNSGTDFNPEEASAIITDINNQSTKSITNFSKEKPFAPSSSVVKTPQERLKRRMQAQLDKQYKLDKKAETDRIAKLKMEQLERDEEISKLASRRRESRRTRSRSDSSSSSDSSRNRDHRRHRRNDSRRRRRSRSRSPSYSKSRRRHHHSHRHSRSRTRSRSPPNRHRSSNRYRRSSSGSH